MIAQRVVYKKAFVGLQATLATFNHNSASYLVLRSQEQLKYWEDLERSTNISQSTVTLTDPPSIPSNGACEQTNTFQEPNTLGAVAVQYDAINLSETYPSFQANVFLRLNLSDGGQRCLPRLPVEKSVDHQPLWISKSVAAPPEYISTCQQATTSTTLVGFSVDQSVAGEKTLSWLLPIRTINQIPGLASWTTELTSPFLYVDTKRTTYALCSLFFDPSTAWYWPSHYGEPTTTDDLTLSKAAKRKQADNVAKESLWGGILQRLTMTDLLGIATVDCSPKYVFDSIRQSFSSIRSFTRLLFSNCRSILYLETTACPFPILVNVDCLKNDPSSHTSFVFALRRLFSSPSIKVFHSAKTDLRFLLLHFQLEVSFPFADLSVKHTLITACAVPKKSPTQQNSHLLSHSTHFDVVHQETLSPAQCSAATPKRAALVPHHQPSAITSTVSSETSHFGSYLLNQLVPTYRYLKRQRLLHRAALELCYIPVLAYCDHNFTVPATSQPSCSEVSPFPVHPQEANMLSSKVCEYLDLIESSRILSYMYAPCAYKR